MKITLDSSHTHTHRQEVCAGIHKVTLISTPNPFNRVNSGVPNWTYIQVLSSAVANSSLREFYNPTLARSSRQWLVERLKFEGSLYSVDNIL